MTQIQKHGPAAPRTRRALHGLVITLIMIGIGAGATYAIFGGVIDNLGAMTDSNRVIIESVNAYTNNDRMVITGNIKNLGSTAMTSVVIDEIAVGDLVVTQSAAISDGTIAAGHGSITLAGLGGDAAATPIGATTVDVDTAVAAAGGTITTGKVDHGAAIIVDSNGAKFVFGGAAGGANAMVDVIGLSTDEGNLESLPAGASKSFRITITGVSAGSSLGSVLDILRTVPAGSELFITMAGTDGQTSTISDVRTAKVKAR